MQRVSNGTREEDIVDVVRQRVSGASRLRGEKGSSLVRGCGDGGSAARLACRWTVQAKKPLAGARGIGDLQRVHMFHKCDDDESTTDAFPGWPFSAGSAASMLLLLLMMMERMSASYRFDQQAGRGAARTAAEQSAGQGTHSVQQGPPVRQCRQHGECPSAARFRPGEPDDGGASRGLARGGRRLLWSGQEGRPRQAVREARPTTSSQATGQEREGASEQPRDRGRTPASTTTTVPRLGRGRRACASPISPVWITQVCSGDH